MFQFCLESHSINRKSKISPMSTFVHIFSVTRAGPWHVDALGRLIVWHYIKPIYITFFAQDRADAHFEVGAKLFVFV